MKYRFDGQNWIVRLEKGELLVENLVRWAQEQQIAGAWLSGLGAAASAELGYYDLTKQVYHWKKFEGLMEITSIQGNIAWDGDEPAIHMHGTFTGHDMKAIGGHIKELEAGGTVELFVQKSGDDKLDRKFDSATGLKLLNL